MKIEITDIPNDAEKVLIDIDIKHRTVKVNTDSELVKTVQAVQTEPSVSSISGAQDAPPIPSEMTDLEF